MPLTATPTFPQTPATEIATLTTPTAITSRANITGTTGLTLLTAVPVTNPKRVDAIVVKSKGTSLDGALWLWIYDSATNLSVLYDEIELDPLTPSTTLPSTVVAKSYVEETQGSIALKVTQQLYVSVSVQQDLNVFATTGQY